MGCFLANAQAQRPQPIEGELIIFLKANTRAATSPGAWLSTIHPNLKLANRITTSHDIFKIRFEAPLDRTTAKQLLARASGVQSVMDNYYLEERSTTPNDPFFGDQWPLELIQAPEVWDFTTGGLTPLGDTIVVAILDSGFDFEHPDLFSNVWVNKAEIGGQAGFDDDKNGFPDDIYGWSFRDGGPIHPVTSHGTSVAGIVGAGGNNNMGITGVNWHVKLLLVSVSTVEQIINGYDYVKNMRQRYNETNGAEGAYVVATNASLGLEEVFCTEVPPWNQIYDELGQVGVLSVGATANDNINVDVVGDLPTTCESNFLIGVTNSDRFDEKVRDAGFGVVSIDLAAPGGSVGAGAYTITSDDSYDESFPGTSAATPHVAGAIALLYSVPSSTLAEEARTAPAATALKLKNAILESADQLPSLEGLVATSGRLNIFQALEYLHADVQEYEVEDPFLDYTERRGFIQLFPNPIEVGTPLQVVYSNADFLDLNVRVLDAMGKELLVYQLSTTPFDQQRFEIDLGNLNRCVYFVVIENGKSPITRKIIVI